MAGRSAIRDKKRKGRGSDRIIQYPEDTVQPNDETYKYYRWCINNNIVIWPVGELTQDWHIRITINGKTHISPERYGENIWEKVHEFYKYYYEKYYKEDE